MKKLYTIADMLMAFDAGNRTLDCSGEDLKVVFEMWHNDNYQLHHQLISKALEDCVLVRVQDILNTCGWSEFCDCTDNDYRALEKGVYCKSSTIAMSLSSAKSLGIIK